MKFAVSLLVASALLPTAAVAQVSTVTNDPAPGAGAILQANYGKAERDIRSSGSAEFDPARSINLGIIMGMTGRPAEAERLFRQVMSQDDVAIVVANGSTQSSREVASRALAMLKAGTLGR